MSNPLNSEQPEEPVGSTNPASSDASQRELGEPELEAADTGDYDGGHLDSEPAAHLSETPHYEEGASFRTANFSRPDDAFVGPERSKRGWPLIVAALVGALVVGGASGGVVAAANNGSSSSSTTSAAPATNSAGIKSVNERLTSALTDVVASASPSVVTINVSLTDGSGGTGSGIVLNDQGYIVTNAHVVTLEGESTSGTFAVQTSTGDVYTAKLIGYDATADTAVLKISSSAKGVKPITFANSDEVAVGNETVAIGSPLGLAGTVTSGIVSAINRPISVPSSDVQSNSTATSQADSVSLNTIQTDAAINSGNSGGALLNADGDLIGMNDAIATADSSSSSTGSSGSIGIGFSIPANYVKRVAEQIISTGSATHGRLGASVTDATTTSSVSFGYGATIRDVSANSPASKAGLKAGDVVMKMDGTVISDATQLTALVRQQAPGTTVKLTYKRGSATSTVSVTLDSASS